MLWSLAFFVGPETKVNEEKTTRKQRGEGFEQ